MVDLKEAVSAAKGEMRTIEMRHHRSHRQRLDQLRGGKVGKSNRQRANDARAPILGCPCVAR